MQKFVVVITGLESKAVLERWAFNVITDKSAMVPGYVRQSIYPAHV